MRIWRDVMGVVAVFNLLALPSAQTLQWFLIGSGSAAACIAAAMLCQQEINRRAMRRRLGLR